MQFVEAFKGFPNKELIRKIINKVVKFAEDSHSIRNIRYGEDYRHENVLVVNLDESHSHGLFYACLSQIPKMLILCLY